MPRRLKVLISAYACEPGKGSEPEVGWQWALQMARFHDVTVLTRANNRGPIEQGLEPLRGRQPLPEFVYHDESPFALEVKRSWRANKLYYTLWQHSARRATAHLHQTHQFDLLHHITFAAFRYPAAIWGHGVPCIWGPVGGMETIPFRLLPWFHPRSLGHEVVRGLHNLIEASPFHILPRRAAASTLILASTREMQDVLSAHGFEVRLMPTIGLNPSELPFRPRTAQDAGRSELPADGAQAPEGARAKGGASSPAQAATKAPLRLLFVGNIITLKGVDLALQAFAKAGANATFTLIGEGDYLPAARKLARQLRLGDRVSFRGRLPRSEVLKTYVDYDVFLFPSLHDTGGYAVIEAMFNELPVICLECGGPALAVRDNCGVRVPIGSRAAVVVGLAEAVRLYAGDRDRAAKDGARARQVILRDYDWQRKGEQMNDLYQEAVTTARKSAADGAYTGIGSGAKLLYHMISFRGLATALLAMLLMGTLGFLSISRLKRVANDIVSDTLPGLSYAGEANAYLADGYRTLLFVVTDDRVQRSEIRGQMESLGKRTSDYLDKYSTQIFTQEDRANYQALIGLRAQFIQARDRVIGLAEAGDREAALALFHQSLMPLQAEVKKAGEKLLEYNMREGQSRGHSIMLICTATQVVVGIIVIAIFALGFFLGLSK